ncbi:unnamed protein product [Prunus armeniaca]|uniref:Uncharacterized protein n=1 Tax=Prunus armeniaca TaxID=36596 RepID=A0A6J5WJU6_PRUAR|nr:unnamed protein product [Prunus armeniaca]CAB4300603.1 unnamed protein product [Prunus armeniaca]
METVQIRSFKICGSFKVILFKRSDLLNWDSCDLALSVQTLTDILCNQLEKDELKLNSKLMKKHGAKHGDYY